MSADLWQRGCETSRGRAAMNSSSTPGSVPPAADVTNDAAAAAVVTVRVPNRFKLDWIRNQYAGRIETVLSELAGKPVRPGHHASRRARCRRPRSTAGAAAGATAWPARRRGGPVAARRNAAGPRGQPRRRRHAGLARSAQPAADLRHPGARPRQPDGRTAALHVAGAPGQMYNPLFIYGGVGLGKTHLIHAVGNALLADKPDARILYLHAEQFITDVVRTTSARPSTS